MEFAIAYKRIPKSKWVALRTNLNNVFFYNIQLKAASWEIPAELEEFMINAFAPQDDEQIQQKLQEKKKQEASRVQFMKMIDDASLSPFGVWEMEKNKINDESLHELDLTEKEKRNLFNAYCKEKAQDEIRAREQNKSLLKDRFFEFLDGQNVSYQLTWVECQKRFKRSSEFMALPIQERESIFAEWSIVSKERAERKKLELRNTLIVELYQLLQDVPQDCLIMGWKKTKKELEKLEPNFYKKFKSLDDKADLFLEWKKNQGL